MQKRCEEAHLTSIDAIFQTESIERVDTEASLKESHNANTVAQGTLSQAVLWRRLGGLRRPQSTAVPVQASEFTARA